MIECDKCHFKCNCPSRLMKVPERSKVDTGEDAAEIERMYRKRKADIESLKEFCNELRPRSSYWADPGDSLIGQIYIYIYNSF